MSVYVYVYVYVWLYAGIEIDGEMLPLDDDSSCNSDDSKSLTSLEEVATLDSNLLLYKVSK